MATQKGNRKPEGKGGLDWGSPPGRRLDDLPARPDQKQHDVPIPVFIALVVMCVVLIVALPALAVMWGEMRYATDLAIEEAKKLKELRTQIFKDFYREE